MTVMTGGVATAAAAEVYKNKKASGEFNANCVLSIAFSRTKDR